MKMKPNNRRNFIKKAAIGLFAAPLVSDAGVFNPAKEDSKPDNPVLTDKILGAFLGIAIGEAMGAPVEGWDTQKIRNTIGLFNKWTHEFLPPTHSDNFNLGKGNGRITDDTLMTEALMFAYIKSKAHLDAYGYEEYFLPQISEVPVFVPEFGQDLPIIKRLYFPDKYSWEKLTIHNTEPRSTGIGNMVNCGLAIMIMPIGAVNAGSPVDAYLEAADFGLAHNESYGIEAGAVMAACYAEAFKNSATIQSVIDAALSVARDGTKSAIDACIKATDTADNMDDAMKKIRRAWLPFSGIPSNLQEGFVIKSSINPAFNKGLYRPSRVGSIEELPVCLAMLKYGNHDFEKTLSTSVLYGNDNDCIAGMACGLIGALKGSSIVPAKLRSLSEVVNKRDYSKTVDAFFEAVVEIMKKDMVRYNLREKTILG
jgi:ADP-ribosylglycohydrolase